MTGELPKLLYLGDVPVELSYYGSTLLYRTLQRYPADRLLLIEGNIAPARTPRRLPGVVHRVLPVGRTRLINSRFHDWYSRWLLLTARRRTRLVARMVTDFSVDAILTVAHGYSWITAARLAEQRRVPLHLIVHDDWPRIVPSPLRPAMESAFRRVYRQAASRLCISPFMAEEYERRYGVAGTVMLPQRSPDARSNAHVIKPAPANRPPVFAFAGTINSPGAAAVLRTLAGQLAPLQGELLIFGPIGAAQAAAAGLALPNVRLGGLVSPTDLEQLLRDQADVLFVPMSFAPGDQSNMRINFPSKLADYTAVGLPLLICGPADSSAVRWAAERPGVAEVVTSEHGPALGIAVGRLCQDAAYRDRLGRAAQETGDRDFSADRAQEIFVAALQSAAAS